MMMKKDYFIELYDNLRGSDILPNFKQKTQQVEIVKQVVDKFVTFV